MEPQQNKVPIATGPTRPEHTLYAVLLAVSFSHLLNDTIQSLIPSLYPAVKETFHLTFGQVGLITFTFQVTASLLQPLVGVYTDRRAMPLSLVTGMASTLLGLVVLSVAWSFPLLLLAVGLVGLGSAVFHPEASRLAYLAAGLALMLAWVMAVSAGAAPARTFYVDAARGEDALDGRKPDSAWRSLARVNRALLAPGDQGLFRRGQAWRGQLVPHSGGGSGVITYGAFGEGEKPIFLGSLAADGAEDWQPTGENVWATSNQAIPLPVDVGNIIFDQGTSTKDWVGVWVLPPITLGPESQ
jgi:MFS family permease